MNHYYAICAGRRFDGDFVAVFRWFRGIHGLCRLYGVDQQGSILLQERYNY
jgi:hypothetical protein